MWFLIGYCIERESNYCAKTTESDGFSTETSMYYSNSYGKATDIRKNLEVFFFKILLTYWESMFIISFS